MDPLHELHRHFNAKQSEKIVRAAVEFAESYHLWAFEDENSLRLPLLGSVVSSKFRAYCLEAHPDSYHIINEAEKKERDRPVILGS